MEEYEKALVELFNNTPLPTEAKMYVLYKHTRDVQDLVRADKARMKESSNEEQKRKESESNEQMS